jgi:hypothetical protein
MSNIVCTINSSNSKVTNNNRLEYQLKTPFVAKDMDVCLASAYLYNSVFNVNQQIYNNSSFQYKYPNGSGFDTVTVTLPNGFYDVDVGINGYLQSIMTQNRHYILNAANEQVFYISLSTNIVYYANTLVCSALPTSLPSGYTLPAGAPALPTTNKTPQVIIQSSNDFGKLIGFTAGTYPATVQSTDYNVNSSVTPQISPAYAFNINGNFINQAFFNSAPNSFYNFTFTQQFGGQERLQPYQYQWYPLTDGVYNSFIISITDQNNALALLQDSDIQVTIFFRNR